MNRTLIALLAALEAFIALAIGVGISLVPLSLMWAVQFDSGVSWDVFYRASADIWLVGHGVDLKMTLDPVLAAAVNLPGGDKPFLISIAPLSFSLLTILLGVRLGRKSFESGARFVGPLSAVATFGFFTILIALSAVHVNATPVMWMAVSFPTAIFALGVFIGARGEVGHSGGRAERVQQKVVGWATGLSSQVKAVLSASLRGGLITAALVIGASAVALSILIIANFASILGIYEGLQGGGGGSLILTAAQLMFMPNFVMWVVSWFIGTGFALGTGSSVSPVGTDLGLVPALPILGAMPTNDLAFGFLGLLVPLLAAFLAAWFIRPALLRALGSDVSFRWISLTVLGIALVAGILIGLLAWASGGAAGPGRLADVGPNALRTGGIAALEFLIAASLGMYARSGVTTVKQK
ncbi:DUF6350 family protein [Aurantimicrobium minutum]|uniref:Putative membrane protein CrgA n=1 Tax=Aurantimicrobium minutum TaxID=708131 RepID=A0A173LYX3_9MICO|nr:DUF6350 family protein [Aurantimicrobium minutum]BAV00101.1 putative membrane protein CrgA [Aurantimicrobium minutum]